MNSKTARFRFRVKGEVNKLTWIVQLGTRLTIDKALRELLRCYEIVVDKLFNKSANPENSETEMGNDFFFNDQVE